MHFPLPTPSPFPILISSSQFLPQMQLGSMEGTVFLLQGLEQRHDHTTLV